MNLASCHVCTGCSACLAACRKGAISFVADHEGFQQPQIDETKCVRCGLCEAVCPVAKPPQEEAAPLGCYALRIRNTDILLSSSSGGAFTCLARLIIERGGCVFGCVMTEPSFVAQHVMAEDECEIAAMRGSKYVQSQVGDTFRACEQALASDRWVLYTGTPCQIRGLRNYLRRDYETLLTVDFICHGVPSPHVWEAYWKHLERRQGTPMSQVSFRDKGLSWKLFSLSAEFGEGLAKISEPVNRNAYLRAFIGNYCLRKSCYVCSAKGGRSGSDITIADFWRIEEVLPELHDPLGVSACLVHTDKGEAFIRGANTSAYVNRVELSDVLRANPSYLRSVAEPPGRAIFMNKFRNARDWNRLLRSVQRGPYLKWLLSALFRRIRRFAERIFGK